MLRGWGTLSTLAKIVIAASLSIAAGICVFALAYAFMPALGDVDSSALSNSIAGAVDGGIGDDSSCQERRTDTWSCTVAGNSSLLGRYTVSLDGDCWIAEPTVSTAGRDDDGVEAGCVKWRHQLELLD